MKKIFRYSALVLGLLLSGFFLLMAMDSFPQSFNIKDLLGFLIHITPGVILAVGVLISFWKPVAGIFIFCTLLIAGTIFYHTYENIETFMLVSLPILVILILLISSVVTLNRKRTN